jgi:hypothetical protein
LLKADTFVVPLPPVLLHRNSWQKNVTAKLEGQLQIWLFYNQWHKSRWKGCKTTILLLKQKI